MYKKNKFFSIALFIVMYALSFTVQASQDTFTTFNGAKFFQAVTYLNKAIDSNDNNYMQFAFSQIMDSDESIKNHAKVKGFLDIIKEKLGIKDDAPIASTSGDIPVPSSSNSDTKSDDGFVSGVATPIPPAPLGPVPTFNGNGSHGNGSQGMLPPPPPPFLGTQATAQQKDQYPALTQFNQLKTKENLSTLKKQIEDSLEKTDGSIILADTKFTHQLHIFLATYLKEFARIESIKSQQKTYNNTDLSSNYSHLLESLNEWNRSITQLKNVINAASKTNLEEIITAATNWVDKSQKYDKEVLKKGEEIYQTTKNLDKMNDAMNEEAKNFIDELGDLKNTYIKLLTTLKKESGAKNSSKSIKDAEIAVFQGVSNIMFIIEKHRLSNKEEKDKFLNDIDKYKTEKTAQYQNPDKGIEFFKEDIKMIMVIFSIYKEFMDGNKEINPGNVAPLFSQEEQKKLANLDAVNSVIRVINIVDKIKIQNFQPYETIKSVTKENLITKSIQAKIYNTNKEELTTINIGLKQKTNTPTPAQMVLGISTKKFTTDYGADDNALIAFVGPAVANPFVDICIMPKVDTNNNIQIYINTDPLFSIDLDNTSPGKIKECLFRTGSPLLNTFNDHQINFDKEIADIKSRFAAMQSNGLKDPAKDEYMLYIIKSINRAELDLAADEEDKTSQEVMKRILYRVKEQYKR